MNRKVLFALVAVVVVGVASAQVRVFQPDSAAVAADVNFNFLVVAPPGMVTVWAGAGNNPPNGWLFCDGSAFSGATYPNLQAALGGTTLPDLRGRVVVGLDSGNLRVTDGTANVVGETGGVDLNTQVPTHAHTIPTDPGHQHNMRATCNGGACFDANDGFARAGGGSVDTGTFRVASGGAHNHGGATGSTGTGAVSNMQPYVTLRYIIKY